MKILDIYGKELWSDDRPTVRESVIAAVVSAADLRGANLRDADLRDADLRGADLYDADLRDADLRGAELYDANLRDANLRGADLYDADLRGANLRDADLRGADLYDADLRGADLRDANLYDANLRDADLRGADLYDAELYYADLRDANLRDANLRGAMGVSRHLCTPLLTLHDQPGPIRAYKLVNENSEGHVKGGLKYVIGESVEVAGANTDVTEHCAAGINVATLDWCMREWRAGYRIIVVEFTAADIAAIPTATDGKFRLFRCKVVGDKDLTEIGLVEKGKVAA